MKKDSYGPDVIAFRPIRVDVRIGVLNEQEGHGPSCLLGVSFR